MRHVVGFPLAQYVWVVGIIVGIPLAMIAAIIWAGSRGERSAPPTGLGPLGLWATAVQSFVAAVAGMAAWLTWSAAVDAPPRIEGYTNYPTWQIIACGTTIFAGWLLATLLCRWPRSGAVVAAWGCATGFAAAFAVSGVLYDTTGLFGVGVAFGFWGWGLGLTFFGVLLGSYFALRTNLRPVASSTGIET